MSSHKSNRSQAFGMGQSAVAIDFADGRHAFHGNVSKKQKNVRKAKMSGPSRKER